jgi:predicted peptidase
MEAGKISPLITAADGTNYMLYLPSNWSTETKKPTHPVLLFLHGAGSVQSEGNVRGISLGKMLADESFMRASSKTGGSPVVTVLPDGSIQSAPWSEGFPFITIMPVAAQRGWQPQFPNVAGLVEMVQRELGGDPSRTYLAGQSMGGNGAWHLGAAYPSLFAAIVPVCGYIEKNIDAPPKEMLEALATKPIWAFHSCVHR